MRSFTNTLLLASVVTVASTATTQAGVISATNNTSGLFDASSGTRAVSFSGLEAGFGTGTVLDVNVWIDFAKADGQSFDPPYPTGTPFLNETVFRLTSPDGTTVNLINAGSFNSGTSAFDGVIQFDDEAPLVVNVNPNLMQAGLFRPVGDLNAFNGESALGTWTLFIEDTVNLDALRFRSYTLEVTTADSVPEPITTLLLGVGLLGTGVVARRRP